MKKPNILLVTTDQQRGDCYGFRGRKVITPHLNSLAESGVDFPNCITPSPVCQPARASILTGALPFSNGVADNGIDLDPRKADKGIASELSKSGYKTSLIGKAHFSTKATFSPTGTPECSISSGDYSTNWTGPYMGFEYVELALFGKWFKNRPALKPPFGQHFEKWFFEKVAGEEGYDLWANQTKKGTGANQTWNSALPVSWHASTWIGDRSIEFLKNHNKSEPFFLWTSFGDPHHPFDCPEPWASLHDPKNIDISKSHKIDLEHRPWWHRASLEGEPDLKDPVLKNFRKKGTRILSQTEDQLREMTANYYGMISLIDHNFGRIINTLNEIGELENTYIFFTSDHGDLLGDHGLYLKGPTFYEGLINVGLIAKGPGIPKGMKYKKLISTIDLASTFFEIAEIENISLPQSTSFLPILRENNSKYKGREFALSEWRVGASRNGVELRLSCVRTEKAKLTLEEISGAGELYDLDKDPEEMNNIFNASNALKLQDYMMNLFKYRKGSLLSDFDEPVGMT